MVSLVSFRKVGKTWKVAAIALLLTAVVWKVVSPVVIRLRSADWLLVERGEHGAAVADQVDHRGVLDVEDLEQVGGVGGERAAGCRARC